MEMTVRGSRGKPPGGFPPLPPPLEIAAAIPTFPQARIRVMMNEPAAPGWIDRSRDSHVLTGTNTGHERIRSSGLD